MKRQTLPKRLPPVTFVLVACLFSCAPGPEPSLDTEPGEPICEQGSNTPTVAVDRRLATLGPSVNGIRRFGHDAYVVQSGSNTIAHIALEGGSLHELVDVGNDRSPWDVVAVDDELWITNFLAGTVTVADRETGLVLEEIVHPSFDGPAGITASETRVYIGNTEFRATNDYGPGSITVIDRASRMVQGTIPTARPNPQNLALLEFADGPRVVIVESGAIEFEDGLARAGSEAAVEVWAETDDPLAPSKRAATLNLVEEDPRLGLPGRPLLSPDLKSIYLASATAPVVFRLNVGSMEFTRGSDDPIVFSESPGDSLNHASIDERGILYVTAFNEDAMYLVDTRCDEVLRGPILLDDTSRLAGPHGAVPVDLGDGRVDAFFVLSLANELGKVRLRYE